MFPGDSTGSAASGSPGTHVTAAHGDARPRASEGRGSGAETRSRRAVSALSYYGSSSRLPNKSKNHGRKNVSRNTFAEAGKE